MKRPHPLTTGAAVRQSVAFLWSDGWTNVDALLRPVAVRPHRTPDWQDPEAGMTRSPVRHVKVADQIADELLDWLRSGELPPGARLPAERELAGRFGVSRTSLRDAVRRLELLGYLDVRQGDGTYARAPDIETLSRPFRDLVHAWPQSAADLLEFRMLLEPEVAALAAERLSDAGAAELRASLARQQTLDRHSPRLTREDVLFHDALAQIAGNTVVLRVLGTLRAVLQDMRTFALPAAKHEQTVRDHERIIQAVLARDRELARQAMREHLQDVIETYQKAVQDAQPDPQLAGSAGPGSTP